ncbi:N-formimino-L-glutamate deiminase [Agrobacterium albertimagni AOL15]|uniref:N-formimino-L-glutamate deiminase n=1 Tax=Agrobacterium albertimagni AOL15 TaxID=1156935 RepID=K2PIM2_9HYPH|nr:formimidoylglutamate deiminase [Agrobacterium albertimagni]EKF60713.1 N-formimino-L-glutamate deiminase [Agrobacterium albertimagni AOL15]
MKASQTLFCERALLPEGWANDVTIGVDQSGSIASIECGTVLGQDSTLLAGPVVPALPNLHSHGFQRAMAGLAEIAGSTVDSFWTWRDTMYRLVGQMSLDDVEAVTTKLYSELLKGGFSQVVEFHYFHHALAEVGRSDGFEMSSRILRSAETAGIGLTHLPVFYAHAGFGGLEPNAGQRPFIHNIDSFLALLDRLTPACKAADVKLGLAIHSLRAATPDEMRAVLSSEQTGGPIHIHVAEQEREVEDCLAWSGSRPVSYLLDEFAVDERWCAIHATHMTAEETARLAKSGAVAGLCPATEANLGDGIYPASEFLAQGGRFGIGTDSHVATSVAEELRVLEYGQRLRDRRRNRLVSGPGASVGRTLIDASLSGGAQAAGLKTSGIRVGARADLVVLDGANPFIVAAKDDQILDRWIFALGSEAVRDVMVRGDVVVQEGRHWAEERINSDFARALKRILQ